MTCDARYDFSARRLDCSRKSAFLPDVLADPTSSSQRIRPNFPSCYNNSAFPARCHHAKKAVLSCFPAYLMALAHDA